MEHLTDYSREMLPEVAAECRHRYNDHYETAAEAFIEAFFGKLAPGEYAKLTEQDITDLYSPCLLAIEPHD
jgi:hypothetical protein